MFITIFLMLKYQVYEQLKYIRTPCRRVSNKKRKKEREREKKKETGIKQTKKKKQKQIRVKFLQKAGIVDIFSLKK